MIKFEIKKLIQNKAALGGVLVALLIFYGLFFVFFFESQVSIPARGINSREAIKLNQKIAEDHSGSLTDKRISQIIDFRVKTANNEFHKNQFMDVFSWNVVETFLPKKDHDKFYGVDRVSRKGIKFLSVNDLGTKVPPSELRIGNFKPWDELFRVMSGSAILIAIMSIYLCAAVFSGDSSKNLLPLLLTTKYGRTKQTRAKLCAVWIIATVIFAVTEIITIGVFANYFSFSGWNTSVQLNFEWHIFDFPIKMNFLQLLLWSLLFQYLGILFTVFLTAFISSYTQNPSTSLAVSLLIFFVPWLLKQVFKSGTGYQLLGFFPLINGSVKGMMTRLNSPGELIFNHININVASIIFVMVLVSVLSCFAIYRRMKAKGTN
ncbi:ABC transporter permease subunit [Xylocopilactobacillus apicola]|uniref:Membrane protein n=1 Tax=Xylocopilactobacillus apicola TaxID=2932184 RepID=A0AAU9DE45_9LACO|nr:ABC transporter permease subunit [Xylocopilactobacillus apicola]BDR59132.1 membrane protein [Xylocopilactobacillus apicola]